MTLIIVVWVELTLKNLCQQVVNIHLALRFIPYVHLMVFTNVS